MNNKKKVIVVDDQDLTREGLKVLLNKTATIEVVAEARNGKEFLDLVSTTIPDVVIMDINMPVMDGTEATRQALLINPELKILALSMSDDEDTYLKMASVGARGFVLKSAAFDDLQKAILQVADSGTYFSNELLRKIFTGAGGSAQKAESGEKIVSAFTKQEIDILKLIVSGNSNEDMVKKLNLPITTVKSYRDSLLNKTACNNSASLVMFAIKHKVVEV